MDLHILNTQMKPLMKKNKTKWMCRMKGGGNPFWTKHDEAEGGRMGGAEKTTLDEAVGPNAGATER